MFWGFWSMGTQVPLDLFFAVRYRQRTMTLGQYLKHKRGKLRQTQAQAAAEVGVTVKTWRSWERGGEPYAGKIPRICRWAGVSLNKLGPYLDDFDEASSS